METIKAEDLEDRSRFTLVWEIDHQAVIPALQPYIWRWSWVGATYIVANIVALTLVLTAWFRSGIGLFEGFPLVCFGMGAGFIVLMPIHESIHALAYKWLGAASVYVRYHWGSLTAYCVADRFVVRRGALTWVCLAPFLVLNPFLAAGALLAPGSWSVVAAGAFLLHVGACSGDFAMANWLWLVGSDDVLSYDDVTSGRTYFVRPVPKLNALVT